MRVPTDSRVLVGGARRTGAAIAVGLLLSLAAGCGGNGPPPPFDVDARPGPSPLVGLEDSSVSLNDPAALDRIAAMADLGATVLRVTLTWSAVAPAEPAQPRDPADPAYRWTGYDAVVREARARRMQVLFTVWGTPEWAADPTVLASRPSGIPTQAVQPRDPADLGDFAVAAARRFTPRGVRLWEGWNEPNVPMYLYPQFTAGRGSPRAMRSPGIYAGLQRAFYAGIKLAAPRATVGGVVTAPAGDVASSADPKRITPKDFIRALDAPGLRPPMDVVSHHPYPTTPPRERTRPGRNYIDLYNLDELVKTVDATYLKGRDLWMTEYGFATESVPEYPLRFTPDEQATSIADAYRRLRANARVKLASYYLFQDHERWRSGLRDIEGTAKPGEAAFALPFARDGAGRVKPGGAVRLVGQVRPGDGRRDVVVEWRAGGGWEPLTTLTTTQDGSFAVTVRPKGSLSLRARWDGAGGGRTSPAVVIETAG